MGFFDQTLPSTPKSHFGSYSVPFLNFTNFGFWEPPHHLPPGIIFSRTTHSSQLINQFLPDLWKGGCYYGSCDYLFKVTQESGFERFCMIDWQVLGKNHSFSVVLTATDLTALISFLLSRFFTILLTCVICMLLLNLMSLIQIPARCSKWSQWKQIIQHIVYCLGTTIDITSRYTITNFKMTYEIPLFCASSMIW